MRFVRRLTAWLSLSLLAAWVIALGENRAGATSSGDELVRQARAHEAVREDDVAARRYMEALSLEPTHQDAWLGLGALRLRIGEPAEAERVYDSALRRLPSLHRALWGRAHARWALGRRAEAEQDLATYATQENEVDALRELSDWYAADGRAPAQLSTWRQLLALAQDDAAQAEARRMVRALVILVDGADPAASPPYTDATRRGLSAVAKRAGALPAAHH